MEERFQKQENWWKEKFKEFQDAMIGRSTPTSDPSLRAPEPHKDHGYMSELEPHKDYGYMLKPVIRALEPKTQPFSTYVSTIEVFFLFSY